MQIYEVFGPAWATTKAMFKDPKSFVDPAKYAQARQAGYAASAERSAEKLRAAGTGQPAVSTPASQLIAQVRNDRAAQQLINTWTSQWPKAAENIPTTPAAAQTPATPAPAGATEPLIIGGQRLDPKDPDSARIIAQAREQGKINEQQAPVDPAAYRDQFIKWADRVVERTTRQSGVIDQIKQQSDWSDRFNKAADQVAETADDPQKNSQAVKEYLTLAIAAARAAHQSQGLTPATRAGTGAGLNDPQARDLARAVGLDATDLTRLNQHMRQNNERINPAGTGSPSLDALLRAAKLLR